MQDLVNAGNSHAFYTAMRQLGAPNNTSAAQLRGPGGAPLPPGQQPGAFMAHFAEVYSEGAAVDPGVLAAADVPPNTADVPPPTVADVAAAVKKLKHWRAADPDGVCAEAVQAAWEGSAGFRTQLHALMVTAMRDGMPAVVKQSELLPFHKKGDRGDPGNYRGIQLVSVLRKLVALLCSTMLQHELEPQLLEYQCGFRPQRSCADQLFTLRMLSELAVELQQRLYVAFVDLRKAFDSVSRPALWVVLRRCRVPEQLIRVVQDLHTDTACRVRVGGRRSAACALEAAAAPRSPWRMACSRAAPLPTRCSTPSSTM